jgi:hypothetical protein
MMSFGYGCVNLQKISERGEVAPFPAIRQLCGQFF